MNNRSPVTRPIETAPRDSAEQSGPSSIGTGGVINNFNIPRTEPLPEGKPEDPSIVTSRKVIREAIDHQNAPGSVSLAVKVSQAIGESQQK